MTNPIPAGHHTVTPVLVFKDSFKAIEFYKKAFGATGEQIMPGPNGKGVIHAELLIGNSYIMMSDEFEGMTHKSPQNGGPNANFYLYVPDVDATYKQALAAGATDKMPVTDMFWGDRLGAVQDPFGYEWTIATHKKDPSQEEIETASKKWLSEIFQSAGSK